MRCGNNSMGPSPEVVRAMVTRGHVRPTCMIQLAAWPHCGTSCMLRHCLPGSVICNVMRGAPCPSHEAYVCR
jgi:hypothetical protein